MFTAPRKIRRPPLAGARKLIFPTRLRRPDSPLRLIVGQESTLVGALPRASRIRAANDPKA